MRKRLGQIFLVTLEYIPVVMTIGLSAYIVLRSQIETFDVNVLMLWVLALLGLLATSTLVERLRDIKKIERFTESTYEYLVRYEKTPSLDVIFSDRKKLTPLETRLQHAKEIVFTGGSLSRLLSEYWGYFEQKASAGCKFKFVIINPESEAAKLISKYVVYEVKDYDTYLHQIRSSLSSLLRLKSLYPNLIEVKICSFVPPLGMLLLDPGKGEGVIQVELYTLSVPTRDRPEFMVEARREPYWYNFFLNQFTQIWNNSTNFDTELPHV